MFVLLSIFNKKIIAVLIKLTTAKDPILTSMSIIIKLSLLYSYCRKVSLFTSSEAHYYLQQLTNFLMNNKTVVLILACLAWGLFYNLLTIIVYVIFASSQ